jgi:hypothetical protein
VAISATPGVLAAQARGRRRPRRSDDQNGEVECSHVTPTLIKILAARARGATFPVNQAGQRLGGESARRRPVRVAAEVAEQFRGGAVAHARVQGGCVGAVLAQRLDDDPGHGQELRRELVVEG